MNQQVLNEKIEQSAPLLSSDEYSHDNSDSESILGKEEMFAIPTKGPSIHPAVFIA
jgi:hypothetical protein